MEQHPHDDLKRVPLSDIEALPPSRRQRTIKAAVAAAALVGLAAAAFVFRDELSLETLASHERQLRLFVRENPALVFPAAFLLYSAVTGLALPGSVPLSIAYGWLFGFWRALLVVSFASTLGATITFLLSRYFLRDLVQERFGGRLDGFNRELEREGTFYLFTLRLTPLAPYTLTNLAMGLTPMRTATFWWVSQLGMLPISAIIVWAGASVPSLRDVIEQDRPILPWTTIAALAAVGALPLATRLAVRRLRALHDASARRRHKAS